MREGEDQKPKEDANQEPRKRIDLSMSQVAGGGLATLTAATAASYLGVYGTVIGTAVMSVLSTAGTAVIQHFVQKSGDRAKDIAERAKARPGERGRARSATTRDLTRPATVADTDTRGTTSTEAREPTGTYPERQAEDPSATRAFPTRWPGDQDETGTLGEARAAPATGGSDSTRELAERGLGSVSGDGRSRWSRWRSLLIPALTIFVLVMLVILAFELFTGRSLTDTVRGNDTHSGPTLLGGYTEQREEPVDTPVPGDGESEGSEGDRPAPGVSEPEEPGGETDRPDQEPETGESGDPGEQTPNPGKEEDDGQQNAPDQDDGPQDSTDQDDTGGDGGTPPAGRSYD